MFLAPFVKADHLLRPVNRQNRDPTNPFWCQPLRQAAEGGDLRKLLTKQRQERGEWWFGE